MINISEKKFLLELARASIKVGLENRKLETLDSDVPSNLKKQQACFVTLTIDSSLRGCIGHLLPVQSLYLDVLDNARSAAFDDPRFPALTKSEFEQIIIEISVLDVPVRFQYNSVKELLEYLNKHKPGVIISKGFNKATFLPQVWEELNQAETFLAHLCMKAGLSADEWKSETLNVEIYGVENFAESNVKDMKMD